MQETESNGNLVTHRRKPNRTAHPIAVQNQLRRDKMSEIPAGFRKLEKSERHPAPGAAKIGPSDPKEKFSVTIRVRQRPGSPTLPDLDTVAATPRSEFKRLSREEFEATYGSAQADLDQVTAFAKSQGLKVEETSSARRSVVVSGTSAQLSRAFGV